MPSSREWLGIFDDILLQGASMYSWEQLPDGAITREEAAAFWQEIVNTFWDEAACAAAPGNIPTPFWDEDTDVDDEAPIETQSWYGTVSDPEAVPAELDFVENAAIWAFTGFLAAATWEIGAAPAILFSTIAPSFVLAVRRGNLGEIIRILVDGQDAAQVDTSAMSEGEVFYQTIVADPDLETHTLMLVQVS